MKHFKRLFSYLVALTMVLSLAAFAGVNVHAKDAFQSNLSITIEAKGTGHTFEAYQIFSGKVDKNTTNDTVNTNNKILSDINWGEGVSTTTAVDGKTLIKAISTLDGFKDLTEKSSASDVAEKLNGKTSEQVNVFAKVVAKYLITDKAHGSSYDSDSKTYKIKGLDAGYYLVQDEVGSITGDTNGVTNKAYTAYILNVVGNTDVKAKSDIPTVDKTVEQFTDNTTNTGEEKNKFQKNADHEIGKTFKFKLAATVPADVNVPSYDSYELKFNDTMSTGITFENIDSVKLSDGSNNPVTVSAYSNTNINGYVAEGINNLSNGGTWSLTINDLKAYKDQLDLTKEITATVIYNAHLNKNAKINTVKGGETTTNENKVDLQYSNNPNVSGLGKTEEHKVYVFAYGIDSTKKANSVSGDPLPKAEFTVKRNGENGEALKFKKTESGEYLLTTDNDGTTTITSGADGKFNIKGLDEGTYYFKETKAPAGYNTVDPFTVTIKADLGTGADVNSASYTEKLSNDENYSGIVVDKSGSTLPSTGGMGTTLLYVAGGILVACAAAYVIISRKKSAKK